MSQLAYESATRSPATLEPKAKEWSFEEGFWPSDTEGGEGRQDGSGNDRIPVRHTPWRAGEDELTTTGRGERQRQALRNRLMAAVLEGIPTGDDSREKGASQQAMEKASLFVDHLGELRKIPHITVADDGEISLYWNEDDTTVEVAFPVDGSVEYYVRKGGERQAGELYLSTSGWPAEQGEALEQALAAIRA